MTAHPSTSSVATRLSQDERETLEQILAAAASHERECQHTWRALSDALGLRVSSPGREREIDRFDVEELLAAHLAALTSVHAAIAPVALDRVAILSPLGILRESCALRDLSDDDADRFLRPLFEAAGVLDALVPRERLSEAKNGGLP